MPINVNCTSFRHGGICLHQAAPRRLFGPARCIVWLDQMSLARDVRLARVQCLLCTPYPRGVIGGPYVPQQPGTVEGRMD